jgi:Uncharacterised nucleotidyltransferase
MIKNYDAHLVADDERNQGRAAFQHEKTYGEEERSINENQWSDRQCDRQALERLLRLGIAHARAERISLESSEEFSRMIPVLCACFSTEELERLVGASLTAKIQEIYRLEMVQNLFLEQELQRILRAFSEAQLPLLLCKGPILAYTFYPQASLRTYHDIDALIHPGDLARARDVLAEMGYAFYEEYRSNVTDRKRAGYNYILKRPESWLEVLIELHTSPHESEFGTVFDVDAMWERAQPVTILGEQALAMDHVDHLLYLCWHYRFHGFSRLLWLYDLVIMLRTPGVTLAWDTLIQRARQQRLATTLYYCLAWCRDLFAVAIPESVFARLRPPFACRLVVERLAMPDMAQALVTVEGQARRTLAHRAMTDRSLGLVSAAARTLFPSPTELARRYMERSRLPLQLYFLFYLIHPWITLAKGCAYLLHILWRRGKSREE